MEDGIAIGALIMLAYTFLAILLSAIVLLVCTGIAVLYTYGIYYCLKRPIKVMRYIITKERNGRRIGRVLRKCYNLKFVVFAVSLVFIIPMCLFLLFMWPLEIKFIIGCIATLFY